MAGVNRDPREFRSWFVDPELARRLSYPWTSPFVSHRVACLLLGKPRPESSELRTPANGLWKSDARLPLIRLGRRSRFRSPCLL